MDNEYDAKFSIRHTDSGMIELHVTCGILLCGVMLGPDGAIALGEHLISTANLANQPVREVR